MEQKKAKAVEIQDLHKSFGSQTVLNGINLAVGEGEILVVLGASGTGKSVLLKLIIGLQKPDSGSIRIHGEDIVNLSVEKLNKIRKKMGFLFQYAALYDSLTVEENVSFALERHTTLSAAERAEHVRELLSRVDMQDAAAKMPSEISGGMKKRVGLARALALDPDLLLLDEPTAGLDPVASAEIHELILTLQQAHALSAVVVTHDIRSAKKLSNRVAFLHEGRMQIASTVEDLAKSEDPFVSHFLQESV